MAFGLSLFGPSGAIRTLGPVNPNHVRYQLRYTRIFGFLHDTMQRKKKQAFRVYGITIITDSIAKILHLTHTPA